MSPIMKKTLFNVMTKANSKIVVIKNTPRSNRPSGWNMCPKSADCKEKINTTAAAMDAIPAKNPLKWAMMFGFHKKIHGMIKAGAATLMLSTAVLK